MFIIIETLNNRFCCSLSSFVLVSEVYSDTDNHNATETTGRPVHERGIACSALYNHDQLTSSRLLVSQSIEVGHNDNSLRSPLPLAATLQEICEMEYFFRLWLQNDAKSQRGDLLAQHQYQGQQLSFRKRLRTEVW